MDGSSSCNRTNEGRLLNVRETEMADFSNELSIPRESHKDSESSLNPSFPSIGLDQTAAILSYGMAMNSAPTFPELNQK